MPFPSALTVCKQDLFTKVDELRDKYPEVLVQRILRIRDMYNWQIQYPDAKDREFVNEVVKRYDVSMPIAYRDLAIIKTLLPQISQTSRDFHRWRYNEMILDAYKKAKEKENIIAMEKAASSYAKYNRVDVDDEQQLPYEMIVVQPFTATDDPSVLGIKPIPNIQEKIKKMLEKYRAETMDIDDVTFEDADLEEGELFPAAKTDNKPKDNDFDDFEYEPIR